MAPDRAKRLISFLQFWWKLQESCYTDVNPITPGIQKTVKRTLKILQQMLQHFRPMFNHFWDTNHCRVYWKYFGHFLIQKYNSPLHKNYIFFMVTIFPNVQDRIFACASEKSVNEIFSNQEMFNSLMMVVIIIRKSVHWFAEQTNGLVSRW